jgi:large subunit ribosomal protein L4
MQLPVIFAKLKQKTSKVALKKEIFESEVNNRLLSQAIRVYLSNKRQGTAKAKTRSEIVGSGRKIWRQKGTGRARHGDRYAPIFVGGGVAHGPSQRDWSLKLSKKMRRKALFSALSLAAKGKRIFIVGQIEDLKPKTKNFVEFFEGNLDFDFKKDKVLLVVKNLDENVRRGIGNIKNIKTTPVALLNAYLVLKFKKIVFTKEAIKEIEKIFL